MAPRALRVLANDRAARTVRVEAPRVRPLTRSRARSTHQGAPNRTILANRLNEPARLTGMSQNVPKCPIGENEKRVRTGQAVAAATAARGRVTECYRM